MVALFNQELMKKATKTTKFMKNWHFFNIINCLLYMFFFSYIIWHNSMSLFQDGGLYLRDGVQNYRQVQASILHVQPC